MIELPQKVKDEIERDRRKTLEKLFMETEYYPWLKPGEMTLENLEFLVARHFHLQQLELLSQKISGNKPCS